MVSGRGEVHLPRDDHRDRVARAGWRSRRTGRPSLNTAPLVLFRVPACEELLDGGSSRPSMETNRESRRTYLPAAGHDWLLPLYDPFVKLLGGDDARRTLLD